ncbi:hypothetical protein EVJ24_12865 [Exiguobacterium sp. SH1S21]|uniref:sensor histidine kinase n=1 Tax=Exiguobacterium sp. SH1S21 TaxID=2510953 RepID=UPI001038B5D1|nr:HAMP domain-containing sensor histidine kinase [Exiguobacterium sp. SH1S21]TCI51476.1 hypothetical protein EVJ24_12865 [Exiguobacterium sp. SH1S21]
MKKVYGRKLFIVLIILLIFIIGQLLGAMAIRYYFLQSKIEELQPHLLEIEEDVSNGDKLSKYNFYIVKAYDIYGEEIDSFNETVDTDFLFEDVRIDETLVSYIPSLINGNEIAELRDIPGLPSSSIVIGEPLVQNGNVTGVIFLLKPASDYKAALQGFYLVFFTTLTIGTLVIIIFLRLFIKERNQLDQMRKDYVANISHELKSPISSIKALTETLADGMVNSPEKTHHYYRIILRESARLEKLINDLLELSRLQSGTSVFDRTSVDTGQVVGNAAEPFLALAEDLDIQLQIADNIPTLPLVYTNEDRIIQVLTILLDNAIKFSRGNIFIEAKYDSQRVTISIRDDGPGIPKDQLSLIFERFHKEDLSRDSRGSGLGLSIAYEIMRQLGEEITVESNIEAGSIFSITLKRS